MSHISSPDTRIAITKSQNEPASVHQVFFVFFKNRKTLGDCIMSLGPIIDDS